MKTGAQQEEVLYRRILDIKSTKGDKKRVELLEALIDAIAEDGWENVSYETLGRRVGMRKGHVAYYFATRESMVETAVKYVIAVGQNLTIEKIRAAKGPAEQIRAWVEGPFDWFEKYPNHSAVMRLLYYLCSYSEAYLKLHGEIRTMGAERAVGLLTPRLAGKVAPAKIQAAAKDLQAIITGALIEQVTIEEPPTMAETRERTVQAVLRLIRGVELAARKKA